VTYAWGHRTEQWWRQNFFLSGRHYVVILHYTKNYCTKVLYFPEIYNHKSFYVQLQVALVSLPPHKFVRPPCWYFWMYEIEEYDFTVAPNGMTPILNFIQIRPAVLELNHTDRQTDMTSPAFISCTSSKERMKVNNIVLDWKHTTHIFCRQGRRSANHWAPVSSVSRGTTVQCSSKAWFHYNTGVLKVALPKYLLVIIRRCQMCIEQAGQQFEQFL
jgi:hypothetical protein